SRAVVGEQVLALVGVAVARGAEAQIRPAVAERAGERKDVAAHLDLRDTAEVRGRAEQAAVRVATGDADADGALRQGRIGERGQRQRQLLADRLAAQVD